mmetsp:Transcript_117460/g.374315  ORF Transcript_117460/g.374315 Transcript_117460/m.374315 type:complete len:434 (-) Transcript_117460:127-1428(-)
MEDPSSKRARLEMEVGGGASEADILSLVSQREAYRQRQQFADSDTIRQQLRDMGVELYDKDREWRCKDGRRGVLFTAGPVECPLSDAEIQARVQEREEARRAKEWERSNIVRDELRNLGVELNDKDNVWRTLFGRQGSFTGQAVRGAGISGQQIVGYVAERDRYRLVQDFDNADKVRASLAQHGVELFDAERLWKATDGRQGVIIPGGVEIISAWPDYEIISRVNAREDARSSKRWSDADAIRDEMRKNGVECLDAQRIWCTTCGRQGPYPGQKGGSGGGGGGGLAQQLAPLQQMSSHSTHASNVHNVQAAAHALLASAGQHAGGSRASDVSAVAAQAIAGLALLAQKQQLPQMQQQQQHQQVMATSVSGGLAPFCDASIQALVNAREQCRVGHDWQTADAIRNDLRSHGVEVWDKEKVWRASDGRQGLIAHF